MSNQKAQKRQLEKARQERAALKREKRQTRGAGDADADAADVPADQASQEQLLADLAALHQRYSDEELTFEEFEAARDELVLRLRVD